MNAETLPPRSQHVALVLAEAGLEGEIREMPGSTRTAQDAADALGCEVGAIASSLVFISAGEPVLILTSGRHRVDTAALAARLARAPFERATPDQVREATGQAIGGVAPVGHPKPLPTVIDSSLADYQRVWAAGGTPRTVFPTSHDELVGLTGGVSVPVAAEQ